MTLTTFASVREFLHREIPNPANVREILISYDALILLRDDFLRNNTFFDSKPDRKYINVFGIDFIGVFGVEIDFIRINFIGKPQTRND